MWPQIVDLSVEDCVKKLREMELDTYMRVLSVIRAKGSLCDDRRRLLGELATLLDIPNDRHKAEARRASNNELLATIAYRLTGRDWCEEWDKEGRREASLPVRFPPLTVNTPLANKIAMITTAKFTKAKQESATFIKTKTEESTSEKISGTGEKEDESDAPMSVGDEAAPRTITSSPIQESATPSADIDDDGGDDDEDDDEASKKKRRNEDDEDTARSRTAGGGASSGWWSGQTPPRRRKQILSAALQRLDHSHAQPIQEEYSVEGADSLATGSVSTSRCSDKEGLSSGVPSTSAATATESAWRQEPDPDDDESNSGALRRPFLNRCRIIRSPFKCVRKRPPDVAAAVAEHRNTTEVRSCSTETATCVPTTSTENTSESCNPSASDYPAVTETFGAPSAVETNSICDNLVTISSSVSENSCDSTTQGGEQGAVITPSDRPPEDESRMSLSSVSSVASSSSCLSSSSSSSGCSSKPSRPCDTIDSTISGKVYNGSSNAENVDIDMAVDCSPNSQEISVLETVYDSTDRVCSNVEIVKSDDNDQETMSAQSDSVQSSIFIETTVETTTTSAVSMTTVANAVEEQNGCVQQNPVVDSCTVPQVKKSSIVNSPTIPISGIPVSCIFSKSDGSNVRIFKLRHDPLKTRVFNVKNSQHQIKGIVQKLLSKKRKLEEDLSEIKGGVHSPLKKKIDADLNKEEVAAACTKLVVNASSSPIGHQLNCDEKYADTNGCLLSGETNHSEQSGSSSDSRSDDDSLKSAQSVRHSFNNNTTTGGAQQFNSLPPLAMFLKTCLTSESSSE